MHLKSMETPQYPAPKCEFWLHLGMLILVLKPVWQTGFQVLKTGFKPIFCFTGLYRNEI